MPDFPDNRTDTVKRSLILAGGGVRLSYHAGVIKALEEKGIHFNHIDGTSGGIFNTAMMASGQKADEIGKRWRALKVKNFMAPTSLLNYFHPFRLSALGSSEGIRKKVFPALGISVDKMRGNNEFTITFNVCNFSRKTIETYTQDNISEDLLIAGMSLPIFNPAVKYNGDWYTDAVWIKDDNLTEAVKRGAEELWVVWCIGNTREYLDGSFLQYVHMIEMSASGGLGMEFDWIKLINDEIRQGKSRYGQKVPVTIKMIKPAYPLPLDPDLFLNYINTHELINIGYAETKASLKDELPYTDMDYKASQMKEPGQAVSFRLLFKGEINLTGVPEYFHFRALVFMRKVNDQQINAFYSSIKIGDEEISTFENHLFCEGKNIVWKCSFYWKQQIFNLTAKSPSPATLLTFLCGLAFKSATVQISSEEKVTETKVIQSFQDRIKMLMYLRIYQNKGLMTKLKTRNALLKGFFLKNEKQTV